MRTKQISFSVLRKASPPEPFTDLGPLKPNAQIISEEPLPPAKNEMPVTGEQVARELAKERLAAEQGAAKDVITYLRSGLSHEMAKDVMRLRWGAILSNEHIEKLVNSAVDNKEKS